ncbi:MAG: autotransporter domain-containing protein [Hyphomonadaceae bacterium]|nr:autotransporter domain-containing protein [Hyphomonadaceae bacterium]
MSLKVRLLLGAAAPLLFAMPAMAQVQITTATTTPIATGTANGGAAANVEITTTGSIAIDETAGATAATINSNNTITNAGAITITDSNNSTNVRIATGITGGYTGTGQINNTEDYTRTDSDTDGDGEGALALGTGRTGILVEPGGTLNGSITLGSGSSISVEGNNSAGVSIQSVLNGDYRQRGTNTIIGSNSVGVEFRENVTGNIAIGGANSTTFAQGEGTVGVRVLGDVAGEFLIDGAVTATGFASTSLSNYEDPDLADDNDTGTDEPADLEPDDLLVGGSAVEIRGDLARGFLVNGAAVGGTDPTDDVKDVIQDFNENRTPGQVSSVGSAPAILIQSLDGAAGDEIRLSRVRESIQDTLDDDDDDNVTEIIGVFDYDFGFINRGAIVGSGLNIGFASKGLRIAGSADGTHQTIVEGGIFNGGSVTAVAFEADAVGINFGAGASTPQLVNTGSAIANVNTETTHDAYGVRIDAGASLPSVANSGLIAASVRGYDGDAVAFQDLSGTVTTFTNSSRVAAGFTDDDTTDDITSGLGRAIALDLSHGSSAVTLTQNDTVDNTRMFGDVLFGAGGDRFNLLSGEVVGDVDFGTGADTLDINSAKLFGDAVFHGTSANVSLTGAEMQGALTLGGAASALSFTGGSIYNGAITSSGGAVSMLVNNSTVNNSGTGTLNLASMGLSNNAKVGFVINNARISGNTSIYNVTGTADIGANTVFTPIFEDFTNQAFTLRVLNAGTLNLGGPLASMLNANSPYLYNVQLVQPNPNALDLVLSVKTAAQLGLNGRQAGAYDAVLDLLEEDSTVAAAVTSLPGANEFLRGWTDLLPGSDAAVMKVLASNSNAAFGATAHRLDLITDKPDAPGGAWTEEFGVYHEGDRTADGFAVSGGGFGVAAGVDLLSNGNALIGAFASLESVEMDERSRTGAPLNVAQTTLGLYGGWKAGNLAVNAAGGAGFVDFTSDRKVEMGGISDRLRADWKGQTYNVGARATYTVPLGFMDVKPYIAADYMSFSQDAYQENAEVNEELEIVAGDSEATLATGSYGLTFESSFGSDDAFAFKPQLSVGYRNVLTWDAPSADYRFAGGSTGTTFNLTPGQEPEDGIVAGLGLNIDSQFLNIKLGYDTEISDSATTHYGSITLRMAFW